MGDRALIGQAIPFGPTGPVDVAAVNVRQEIVLFTDDTVGKITAMFDCYGDATKEYREATIIVTRHYRGKFYTVDMRKFIELKAN